MSKINIINYSPNFYSKKRIFKIIALEGAFIISLGILLGIIMGFITFEILSQIITPLNTSKAKFIINHDFYIIIILVLVAGLLDARRLIRTPGSGDLAQKALGAALALALGGLGLLTVEVTLVALTSSLTLAVAAVAKELVLIGVSIGLLKNDVSPSGYGGFALTASGVLAYNVERYKRRRPAPPPQQIYEQVDLRPPSLVSVPPMDDAELA